MTSRTVLILSCFLLSSRTHAEGGSVAGRVTAVGDTTGLAGVNVLIQGTVRGTSTNPSGHYGITNIPSGKRTLVFSCIGYQRVMRSVEIAGEDGTDR